MEERRKNGERMIVWFNDLKEFPVIPVVIGKHCKIWDLKKYIETQKTTIEANLKDPFNRLFVNAYMRLFELKKIIDKH